MEREEVEYSHHFTHDSIDEYIYIAYFKRYLTILTQLIKSKHLLLRKNLGL
jgi:hypothetical protein